MSAERSMLFSDAEKLARIRAQLRDAVDEAKAADALLERDKRRRSIRQFLQINEVEALLSHIEDLERRALPVGADRSFSL